MTRGNSGVLPSSDKDGPSSSDSFPLPYYYRHWASDIAIGDGSGHGVLPPH